MSVVKLFNTDNLYYIIVHDFLCFDWAQGLGKRIKNCLGLDFINLNSICFRGVNMSSWELKEDSVIMNMSFLSFQLKKKE